MSTAAGGTATSGSLFTAAAAASAAEGAKATSSPAGGQGDSQGAAGAAPGGESGGGNVGDWKAAGYEHELLAGAHGGKYKTLKALIEGTEQFGSLVNTHSEEAKTAAAKAAELEAKWKGVESIVGAPVDAEGNPAPYEFGWSEEATVDPELSGAFEGWLRKHNLSQGVAQEAAQLLETYAAALALGNQEAELAGVVEDYGGKPEEAKAKLAELQQFWTEKLGDTPAEVDALHEVASTRSGIRFLETLRSRITLIQNGRAAGGSGPESAEQILAEAAGKPDFFSDPRNYQRLTAARERELAGKS